MLIIDDPYQMLDDDIDQRIFERRADNRKHKMHTQIANKCLSCGSLFYTDYEPKDICNACLFGGNHEPKH